MIGLWSASAGASSLFECRTIDDVAARAACYDAIVDGLIQGEAAGERVQGAAQAPSQGAPRVDAEAPTPPSQVSESEVGLMPERRGLEAVVEKVQRTAYGKLVLTLDNGQVWKQIDTDRLWIRTGDAISIRPASSNSYLLRKASGGTSIRVERQ